MEFQKPWRVGSLGARSWRLSDATSQSCERKGEPYPHARWALLVGTGFAANFPGL